MYMLSSLPPAQGIILGSIVLSLFLEQQSEWVSCDSSLGVQCPCHRAYANLKIVLLASRECSLVDTLAGRQIYLRYTMIAYKTKHF